MAGNRGLVAEDPEMAEASLLLGLREAYNFHVAKQPMLAESFLGMGGAASCLIYVIGHRSFCASWAGCLPVPLPEPDREDATHRNCGCCSKPRRSCPVREMITPHVYSTSVRNTSAGEDC